MSILAKIGIYGDLHLGDHAYGAHTAYDKESLQYLREITRITRERQLDYLIGTGDLTFGKFTSLDYRDAVDKELREQFEITRGNRFEVMGNHDSATNGMTEYEYYTKKGLLKRSQNITLGKVHITMLDYLRSGDYKESDMNIVDSDTDINVVIAHQYFRFSNSLTPNFGKKAIELDNFGPLFGADYLICGHIHHIMNFSGKVVKNGQARDLHVNYLGCMMRPAYHPEILDTVGHMAILTVHDDGHMDYDIEDIPLWDIADSFNISEKAKEKQKKTEKAERVDISDIVQQLNSRENTIGDPEDIVRNMENVADSYKNKALALLAAAE